MNKTGVERNLLTQRLFYGQRLLQQSSRQRNFSIQQLRYRAVRLGIRSEFFQLGLTYSRYFHRSL